MIIGLNSDLSVKNLKGKNRPINSQSNRAHILAALEVVDYVVIFKEEGKLELREITIRENMRTQIFEQNEISHFNR